jgi:hypothetical protein
MANQDDNTGGEEYSTASAQQNAPESNPTGQVRIETWPADGGIDNPQRITDESREPIGPEDSGAHPSVGNFSNGAFRPMIGGVNPDGRPAPLEHGWAGGLGDVQGPPPPPRLILPDAPPPDTLPAQYHWKYAKVMGEFHLDELRDNQGEVVKSHAQAMEIAEQRAKKSAS